MAPAPRPRLWSGQAPASSSGGPHASSLPTSASRRSRGLRGRVHPVLLGVDGRRGRRRGHGRPTVSAARSADAAARPLATSTPVVFVHGYTGSASNWVTAMSVFRANGWSSSNLFAYEYNSYGNNITNAKGLATYVDNVKARTGASKVAIVNHSMGGLVSQYYLKVLGGNTSVSHLASIAGRTTGPRTPAPAWST
ncbi:alpha/beta fold hydrolase [Streptomyces sp. M19]